MSIINNAHPGSSVRLLCLIDRILSQRDKPIQRKKLVELCRPESLPRSENGAARFESNLKFWIEEGLWAETDEGVEIINRKRALPERVLRLLIKNCSNEDLLNGNRGQPFLKFMACLLALPKYSFAGGVPTTHKQGETDADPIETVFKNALPTEGYRFNRSNESSTFLDYAFFLGFIEPLDGFYIVDPTRAVQYFLDNVFDTKPAMGIADFLEKLGRHLPIVDGGEFREMVEADLRQYSPLASHEVSSSLSHALLRLRASQDIILTAKSDDPNARAFSDSDEPAFSEVRRRVAS